MKTLLKEIDGMKDHVEKETSRGETHRQTLQNHYNEKLSKMKDICAQYFSKYEKYLAENQNLVQSLEEK